MRCALAVLSAISLFLCGVPHYATAQAKSPGIPVRVKAWYFPDTREGYANMVLAGVVEPTSAIPWPAVSWNAEVASVDPVAIIRQWRAELALPPVAAQVPGQGNLWVQEMEMPPGQYILAATAHGLAGGQGQAEFPFQVNAPDPFAFVNVSTLLLADGCSAGAEARSGDRRNLFDPLREGDCSLAPLVTGLVPRGQPIRALLRLYPGSLRSKRFPGGWRAQWTLEDAQAKPLRSWTGQIEPAAIRGWKVDSTIVTATLPPESYRVSLRVTGPEKREFTVSDNFKIQ
jgi:hypothetical protein